MVFLFSFSPFPEVAEAVQSELETYRASEDEVKKLKAAMVRRVAVIPKLVIKYLIQRQG